MPTRLVGLVLAAWVATAPAATAAQRDPFHAEQWGIELIGARPANEVARGTGITIAIVDTGVDLTHQDLAAKIVPGYDFVDDDADPQDEEGHGTHVAGIAAAVTDNGLGIAGVASAAKIMPIRVLDDEGSGNVRDVIDGVKWAVDHGADVVNLSLSRTAQAILGSGIEEAVRYAWDNGVVPVVAAGNDYVLSSGFSDEPAVVVSATTRGDTKPSYSSGVGSAQWGMAAPGGGCSSSTCPAEEGIVSTWWNGSTPDVYAYLSGTSMAAPHVAGAAAVLLSQGLTPQQTVDRLLSTAVDVGSAGRDSTFGAGRLDLAAAVGAPSAQAPSPAPSAPTPSPPASPRPSSGPAPAPAVPAPSSPGTPRPNATPSPSASSSPSDSPSELTPPQVTAAPFTPASPEPVEVVDPPSASPSTIPAAGEATANEAVRGRAASSILPWFALALVTGTTAAIAAVERRRRREALLAPR